MAIYMRGQIHATGITLDKSSITLTTVGQTSQLTATLTPSDATDTVTWSSSNTSIATVNSNGLVTCVTPGSATITATANGYSATCDVSGMRIPSGNILGYRPLDGNATDYSGNNRNGTLYNESRGTIGTRKYLKGTWGGSGAYMRTPIISIAQGGTLTYCFWFNPESKNSNWHVVFGCYSSSDAYHVSSISANSTRFWCNIGYGTGSSQTDISSTNFASGWHMITVTLKNGEQKVYMDTTLQATSTQSVVRFTGSATYPRDVLYTGQNGRTGPESVGCVIMSSDIWNATMVADVYNHTKGYFGIS